MSDQDTRQSPRRASFFVLPRAFRRKQQAQVDLPSEESKTSLQRLNSLGFTSDDRTKQHFDTSQVSENRVKSRSIHKRSVFDKALRSSAYGLTRLNQYLQSSLEKAESQALSDLPNTDLQATNGIQFTSRTATASTTAIISRTASVSTGGNLRPLEGRRGTLDVPSKLVRRRDTLQVPTQPRIQSPTKLPTVPDSSSVSQGDDISDASSDSPGSVASEFRRNTVGELCLPGTRGKILRRIGQWLDDRDGSSVFWLSGMAGSGKSTIYRTAVATYRDVLVHHYTFGSGDDARDQVDYFQSLAAKLFGLGSMAYQSTRHHAETTDLDQEFEFYLREPFEILRPITRHVVLMIDLDGHARGVEIGKILELLGTLRSNYLPHLRIFITSRPEYPSVLETALLSSYTSEFHTLEDIECESTEQDIRTYIEFRCSNFVSDWAHLESSQDWPGKDHPIQALVDIAKPIFKIAAIICSYIQDGGDADSSTKRLKDVIRMSGDIPSLYTSFYQPITYDFLQSLPGGYIGSIDDFHLVFGPMLFLAEPVSLFTFARLSKRQPDDIVNALAGLRSIIYIPQETDAVITPLHASLRSYLTSPAATLDHLSPQTMHKALSIYCNDRLRDLNPTLADRLVVPEDTKDVEATIWRPRVPVPSHIAYACFYYTAHAISGYEPVPLIITTAHFLMDHQMIWLETVARHGWLPRVIQDLQIVKSRGSDPSVSQLLPPRMSLSLIAEVLSYIEQIAELLEFSNPNYAPPDVFDPTNRLLQFQDIIDRIFRPSNPPVEPRDILMNVRSKIFRARASPDVNINSAPSPPRDQPIVSRSDPKGLATWGGKWRFRNEHDRTLEDRDKQAILDAPHLDPTLVENQSSSSTAPSVIKSRLSGHLRDFTMIFFRNMDVLNAVAVADSGTDARTYQRELQHLIKKFCDDLSLEPSTQSQTDAVNYLSAHARHFSVEIVKQAKELADDLPGPTDTHSMWMHTSIEDDQSFGYEAPFASNEEDAEDIPEPADFNVHNLGDWILRSQAYIIFKLRLLQLVHKPYRDRILTALEECVFSDSGSEKVYEVNHRTAVDDGRSDPTGRSAVVDHEETGPNPGLGRMTNISVSSKTTKRRLDPVALSSLALEIASVPPRHFQISSSETTYMSMSDYCKRWIEETMGENWNWWPLSPRKYALQPGFGRLQWRTPCGDTRFVDLPEAAIRGVLNATQWAPIFIQSPEMNLADGLSTTTAASGVGKTAMVFTVTSTGSATSPNSSSAPSVPMQGLPASQQDSGAGPSAVSSQPSGSGVQPTTPDPRHVYLGIKSGNQHSLSVLRTDQMKTDIDFFRKLKEEYLANRGLLNRWFSMWRYDHCQFYRFRKYGINLSEPTHISFPPDTDTSYEFTPRPLDDRPPHGPISESEFRDHFYKSCHPCHSWHRCQLQRWVFDSQNTSALHALPKRIQELQLASGKREEFWGIFARERRAFAWVLAYAILCNVPGVIFFFLWLFRFKHAADLQDGIVPVGLSVSVTVCFVTLMYESRERER